MLRLYRKRRIENGGCVLLAIHHRLEAEDAGTYRLDRVVHAGAQPVLKQDFLRLQRIGGIGRIDHQRTPAQIGKRFDLGPDEELVHPAVAAGDNHHVVLAKLDHGQGIVDRRMHDVELARCKAIALTARTLGKLKVDIQSVLCEDAVRNSAMKGQRLCVGKRVHPQQLCLVSAPGSGGQR